MLKSSKGDLLQADVLAERGADLLLEGVGHDPEVVAQMIEYTGYRCRDTLRLQDAEKYFSKALEIRRKLDCPDANKLAWSLLSIAEIQHGLEKPEKAESFCAEAIQLLEKGPVADWRSLAIAYNNLGMARFALRRYQEAANALSRALEIVVDRIIGEHHLADTLEANIQACRSAMTCKENDGKEQSHPNITRNSENE